MGLEIQGIKGEKIPPCGGAGKEVIDTTGAGIENFDKLLFV